MYQNFKHRYHLVFQTLPYIFGILVLKFLITKYPIFSIAYFPLIGNLVGANFFLMGFLVGETLKEFRQAEKIPAQIASMLENMVDLIAPIEKIHPKVYDKFLVQLQIFAKDIRLWIYRKYRSGEFYEIIRELNDVFDNPSVNEDLPSKSFEIFSRERNLLRAQLFLIDAMRKTNFVSSSFLIGQIYSILMIFLLLFTKFENLVQSYTLLTIISFLFIYLLLLVKDLDNPFSYDDRDSPTSRVSLKQIQNFEARVEYKLLHKAKK